MNLENMKTEAKSILFKAIANRFDSSVLLEAISNFDKCWEKGVGVEVKLVEDFEIDTKTLGNMATFFVKASITIKYQVVGDMIKRTPSGVPVKVDGEFVRVPGAGVEFSIRYEHKDGGSNGASERITFTF